MARFPLRSLVASLAAVALLTACGAQVPPPGGGGPDPDPDPNTGTGAWHTLPASSFDRQEVSYVALDGRLYLAGGSAQHEVYDPVSQTWSTVASLPGGWVDHIQGVALNGRIYYIGGLTGWPQPHSDLVRIYDPATDSFTAGAPMPRGRGGGGVATDGSRIYYAGGMHNGQAVAWFDAYDPATDTWQQLPDMPIARDHFHGAILGGTFYAIGGRDSLIDATDPRVDAYAIGSGTWNTLNTTLPTPRGGFATAVLGNEILIIGGEGGGQTFDTVEAYDPAANTWRTLAPLPTARHGIQAAVCDGGVYIAAGGRTQGGANPSSVHEVFFFGEPTPCGAGSFSALEWTTGPAALQPGRMEAQGLAHQGQLYVIGGYTSWSPDPLCTTSHSMALDVAAGAWRQLAPLPDRWTHAGAVADGDNLYFAGGRANDAGCTIETSTDTVWRYHIPTDTWHDDLPPLPEARSSGGFVKVGRTLHFFGGVSSGHPGGYAAYFHEEADHWALSLDGGTWQSRAPLPQPRSHLAAVVLNGQIYAIGGQLHEGSLADTLTSVHRYDPATDAWTAVAPLPAPLSHMTASTLAIGGRIIVLGGERAHGSPVADVLAFDPATNTWSTLTPFPTLRRSGVAGYVQGKLYYATGGGSFTTTTYVGTPR
jgi:N-acetylneuraminic acid mutarotase